MKVSLKSLEKEKKRLLAIREKEMQKRALKAEKANLKKEIFMLKHGRKIEGLRNFASKAQKWADKYDSGKPKKRNTGNGSDYGYDMGGSIF